MRSSIVNILVYLNLTVALVIHFMYDGQLPNGIDTFPWVAWSGVAYLVVLVPVICRAIWRGKGVKNKA
jgi:hypothetical protein